MTSRRGFQSFALIALLVSAAVVPAQAYKGPPQIDPGEDPYPVTEAPPSSCPHGANTVILDTEGFAGGSNDYTIVNQTSAPTNDALKIDVTVNGQHRLFWVSVPLASGASVTLRITYLQPVTLPVISTCNEHPIGVVDSPDPVVSVAPPPVD